MKLNDSTNDSPARGGWLATLLDGASALNHDFCPWANRWVYWMKNPLWCLFACLGASIACGVLVNPNVLVLSSAMLLVLALGIVWPAIAIRGLSAELTLAGAALREGDTTTMRLRVTNRWPWPIWGLSVERGFSLEGETGGIALAKAPGWSTSEFSWTFQPPRRGVYPSLPPFIETRFPFGLFRASRAITLHGEIVVWPRTAALGALPETTDFQPLRERFADRRAGEFGDTLGTRPFRPGDALRRVHWPMTARLGRMIVSERQAPTSCAARILLDTAAVNHIITPEVNTLEQSIRMAASIAESLAREHAQIEFVLAGRLHRVATPNDLRRLFDALARIPHEGNPTTGRLPPRKRGSGAEFVVMTELGVARQAFGKAASTEKSRLVLITSSREDRHAVPRAWLSLDANEPLDAALSNRWRRSCHAA